MHLGLPFCILGRKPKGGLRRVPSRRGSIGSCHREERLAGLERTGLVAQSIPFRDNNREEREEREGLNVQLRALLFFVVAKIEYSEPFGRGA